MLKLDRPEDIGALVRDRRRARGLTQQQLGDEIGARQAWISAIENGKPTAQLGKAMLALRALGVTLSATYEGMGETKPTTSAKRPPISIKDIVDG